jgi:hypothetical protein
LPFVLERLHNFSTGEVGLSYFTFLSVSPVRLCHLPVSH